MKKSGYRTVFHIYLIFFLTLLGTILVAASFFFLLITTRQPDGSSVRSDWPKTFAENFREQIIFIDHTPQIKQAGITSLQENKIGLQILDSSCKEVFHYQKPESAKEVYSSTGLLHLLQTGQTGNRQETVFVGTVVHGGEDFTYLLYFPMKISKITMYFNGDRFTEGKKVILAVCTILFFAVIISGVLYGFLTTRTIKQLSASIQDISSRSYHPTWNHGTFQDLYDSLHSLDQEIRASDQLRERTEKMQKEWISNITHDLKTPLSPIKGYAETMLEDRGHIKEQHRRYAGIILKNATYMETLISDLKLTFQLENNMLSVNSKEQNIVRFLRELIIDILNTPEYEDRIIHFESNSECILYSFDATLFTRAFRNLIVNAFVHGTESTEVNLWVQATEQAIQISVADNGQGMGPEEIEHLFDRYYRGVSMEQKPEGTGLGLAITKSIFDLHGGVISVSSIRNVGTTFQIVLSTVKVN